MTAQLHHPHAPTVRLLPAPRCEPPTDAELAATGAQAPPPTAPALPFDLNPLTPAAPLATARVIPHAPVAPAALGATNSAARTATRRFLAACLEIIGGFRPAQHIRPLCLPERFADIVTGLQTPPGTPCATRPARGAGRSARTPVLARPSTGSPSGSARPSQPGPTRISLRRVQISEAIEGVAEVAAVLARREQVWAMAIRLEHRGGSWLCAHLEVL